ncbi:MAG: protease modulator HflC [Desulfovibrionaceae bacterium]|jgi:membrane protease subunit HflC|uniref:protease modulator HflC n=1 Tax=Desulfovibrio TaxID=872 RepID=UPI000401E991|nr:MULTISPECIES: protease modulator HflC [Desulfovibrio]MDY0305813.1 protease modulator HflC [Desulfovibrionaceae bacterium]HMM39351.1 protease modulator HflC [Desulfovibrio sp.]
MTNKQIALVAGAVLLLLVLTQTAFVVHQTETAIVVQLGKPVTGALKPGLHFKLPLVQSVTFFDARVLDYDAKRAEILTEDKKAMVVDHYTKWRITDPLLFYQTVRTEAGAQARLDDITYAALREALGRHTLIEVVSEKRTEIMEQVVRQSQELLSPYGILVVDVRIKRTDLPPENERAIFGRMQAERERQAKQYRSEGQEEAAKIRAQADKERTVLLAEAERQASTIRGEGDAKATRTYAEAYGQSPEFYAFKRSLEAYESSLKDNTRLVLTPGSPFLRYFQ